MASEDPPDQRYRCANCCKDVTLRLKCAEPSCRECDLCLECFSHGAEFGHHKCNHGYEVIDDGIFSLLTDDWGAIEEVLLLDAVEQEGLGNWLGVAKHVTTKRPRQLKEYYEQMYINSVIGKGAIVNSVHHSSHLDGQGGQLSPDRVVSAPPQMDTSEQSEIGYLPKRNDFEYEFFNDAEGIISGLSSTSSEDSLLTELKIAHLEIFNRQLKKRQLRKRMCIQHSLLGSRQKHIYKKSFTKEEREMRGRYRSLTRLLNHGYFEQLMSSLKNERDLTRTITQLQQFRQQGFTQIEEVTGKTEDGGDTFSLLTSAEKMATVSGGVSNEQYLITKLENILKSQGHTL